jgi:hypothetical protein
MNNLLNRMLNVAVVQAAKSDMYHQHGAVLFTGRKIMGIGYNRIDRCKVQRRAKTYSTHAEGDCTQRLLCSKRYQEK